MVCAGGWFVCRGMVLIDNCGFGLLPGVDCVLVCFAVTVSV